MGTSPTLLRKTGYAETIPLGGRTLRVVAIRDDDADQPPILIAEGREVTHLGLGEMRPGNPWRCGRGLTAATWQRAGGGTSANPVALPLSSQV
jgi:hypothetical protein